ncbi:hypothetical protein LCGC14_0323380 [marine sediment metagenome]|uniref:Uncharacterized protein n=1 Tax=marine sediment metagenome TaxID=412755 RepID=A0A0F9TP63_9ZZZZ
MVFYHMSIDEIGNLSLPQLQILMNKMAKVNKTLNPAPKGM